MGRWLEEAKTIRATMNKAGNMLDDKQASEVVKLYPSVEMDGSLIKSGTRINWNGELKRASVDLWASEGNMPDTAPELWESIMYKDGFRLIPDEITAGTAFQTGEKGWWNGVLYESTIDANVWNPDAYAEGWVTV